MPSASLGVRLTLLLPLLLACGQDGAKQRPNVLFILIEDQGAHTSFVGTPGLHTPALDGLAREGVYLRRAYVTYPVCSAAKASIYTGLYTPTHGLRGNTLDYMKPASELTDAERAHPFYGLLRIRDDAVTLIELLEQAGYYTGVTRKLNVLPNEKFPFDRFIETNELPDDAPSPVAGFIAEAVRAEQPFFLMYNIRPPHRPFRNSDVEPIGVSPEAVSPPGFLPDTEVIRKDWAEYLDAIQQADARVGEALKALRDSGQQARTIVVVTSDHGPAFQRGKMAPYDFGLHVPLILQGPGIAGGRASDAMVSQIDLMPTLLDLLELETPAGLHGRSLAPLLRGEPGGDALGRELVFAEVTHGFPRAEAGMQERSVFDGELHLIYRERTSGPRIVNPDLREWSAWRNRSYDETVRQRERFPEAYQMLAEIDPARLHGQPPRLELYRLSDDPDELRDLSQDPGHQLDVQRLLAAIRAWSLETGDRGIRMRPPGRPAVGRSKAGSS